MPEIVATSGTSGVPKQVVLSDEAIAASTDAANEALGGAGQWVLSLPESFIAGRNVVWRNAASGAPLVRTEGSFTAEAFTATFGILGLAGLAVFAVGSVLLFDGDIAGFTLATPVIVLASLASLLLLAVMLAAVLRAHRRRVVTGDEALLQDTGEVLRWSGLQGQVQAQGETWQARAVGPLTVGQRVRITARDGLTIVVEPLTPPT